MFHLANEASVRYANPFPNYKDIALNGWILQPEASGDGSGSFASSSEPVQDGQPYPVPNRFHRMTWDFDA